VCGVSVTRASDGTWCGLGWLVGTPGVSGTLTGGWILGRGPKSPEQVNSFVQGWSFGVNGMVGLPVGPAGGFEMGDPFGGNWLDPNNWAFEPDGGIGSPADRYN
jgi:hypothetical protein